jgi:hypothetical protein
VGSHHQGCPRPNNCELPPPSLAHGCDYFSVR